MIINFKDTEFLIMKIEVSVKTNRFVIIIIIILIILLIIIIKIGYCSAFFRAFAETVLNYYYYYYYYYHYTYYNNYN